MSIPWGMDAIRIRRWLTLLLLPSMLLYLVAPEGSTLQWVGRVVGWVALAAVIADVILNAREERREGFRPPQHIPGAG